MMRVRCLLIWGMVLAVACPVHLKAAEQFAFATPELTADQVKRYFDSYAAIHAMASQYWGDRRYTPRNRMLEPKGTYYRALSEMDAAGALPDFETLLKSYGYSDSATWMRINQRIALAYGELQLIDKHPANARMLREDRLRRRDRLAEERAKLPQLPEGLRVRQEKYLDMAQQELERELLVERDAGVLLPFRYRIKEFEKHSRPSMD